MRINLKNLTLNLVRVDEREYKHEYFLCDQNGLEKLEEEVYRHNDSCECKKIQYLYRPKIRGINASSAVFDDMCCISDYNLRKTFIFDNIQKDHSPVSG